MSNILKSLPLKTQKVFAVIAQIQDLKDKGLMEGGVTVTPEGKKYIRENRVYLAHIRELMTEQEVAMICSQMQAYLSKEEGI